MYMAQLAGLYLVEITSNLKSTALQNVILFQTNCFNSYQQQLNQDQIEFDNYNLT